jgi:hypothetical protein
MKNLFLLLSLVISGCATQGNLSDISISKSGANFEGNTYTSRADLAAALVSKRGATIHLVLEKDVPYKQVEMTMGAVQDAAAVLDVGLVGKCKGPDC